MSSSSAGKIRTLPYPLGGGEASIIVDRDSLLWVRWQYMYPCTYGVRLEHSSILFLSWSKTRLVGMLLLAFLHSRCHYLLTPCSQLQVISSFHNSKVLQPPNVSNPKLPPVFFSWRRLYAALAGVEEPFDAILQPPPRHDLSNRLQPSAVPPRSSASDQDHLHHVQLGHCRASAGRAPHSPNAPSLSPLAEAEPPPVKRSRSRSHGCPPAEAVAAGAAAPPNDTSKPAACSLRVGERSLRAGAGGRVSEPAETQRRGYQRKSWKMRLKEDMATGRKPSETFVFAGQSK